MISLRDSCEENEGVDRLDTWILHLDGVQDENLAIRLRQLILKIVTEQTGMERFKNRFVVYTAEGRLP